MTANERYLEYYLSGQAAREIAYFQDLVRDHGDEKIKLMVGDDPIMLEWYERHASGASMRALERFIENVRDLRLKMEGGFVEPKR